MKQWWPPQDKSHSKQCINCGKHTISSLIENIVREPGSWDKVKSRKINHSDFYIPARNTCNVYMQVASEEPFYFISFYLGESGATRYLRIMEGWRNLFNCLVHETGRWSLFPSWESELRGRVVQKMYRMQDRCALPVFHIVNNLAHSHDRV